jgi:hypothetical protein
MRKWNLYEENKKNIDSNLEVWCGVKWGIGIVSVVKLVKD